MSNWGKAHINNTNGFGQAVRNSGSGYGSVYDKSESGDTNLTGNPPYFAMTIDSTESGVSNNDQFEFTGAVGEYDVDAVQGGVVVQQYTNLNNEATIQLPSAGIYQVRVKPKGTNPFNRIEFDNGGDKDKVLSIDSFGPIQWSSFQSAFRGCSNLTTSETNPDLSNVTNMSIMFFDASAFNGNIGSWDTSSVFNMRSMFVRASSFNQDISKWNTANVTQMFFMFFEATSFKQDISAWNIANVTKMDSMFQGVDMNIASTTTNYDNLLIKWSQQNVQPNVDFNAGNSKYNPSATLAGCSVTAGQAKAKLVNTDNWDITDGGTI